MTLLVPKKLLFLLLLGMAISIAILVFSELGARRLVAANKTMESALTAQATLNEVLALVVDAETSQRGYLLTGKPEYLDPYRAALPRIEGSVNALRESLVAQGSAAERERAGRVTSLIGKKLAELEATLALFEKSGKEAALELTNTGIGQRTIEQIRVEIAAMSNERREQIASATARWERDIAFSRLGIQVMTGFTLLLLLVVKLLLRRDIQQRERSREAMVQEQQRLEAKVERRTAELSELSNHLQTVVEDEKSRLARDLHDELGGILVSAKMDVSWVEERLKAKDPEAAAKLARAQDSLDNGVSLKRRIIEELRPTLLDNLGLGPALEWQAHEVCDRAGLACDIRVPSEAAPLPPRVSIALFRIAQEALTNVLRYANARRVEFEFVQTADSVSLLIADDGVGIPDDAQNNQLSHGISGMRQRARALHGEFSVRGLPGRGTIIEVSIPLPNHDEDAVPSSETTAA